MQRRDDADAHRNALAELDDAANLLARGAGQRDDDVIDLERLDQLAQIVGGAENTHPINHRPLFIGVLIDEAFDFDVEVAAAANLARRQGPGAARADQQDRLLWQTARRADL